MFQGLCVCVCLVPGTAQPSLLLLILTPVDHPSLQRDINAGRFADNNSLVPVAHRCVLINACPATLCSAISTQGASLTTPAWCWQRHLYSA